MSVVSIHVPMIVYREEQNFDWRVYVLLSLVLLTCWSIVPFIPVSNTTRTVLVLASGIVPTFLLLCLLRMTTEVTPTGIVVWFGWIPTYRRAVPIDGVTLVEVITYRPLRDYGGWGIRYGRDGEHVMSARGDQGVRIHMTDGSRLVIGTQRPTELAQAIQGAVRPGG